MDNTLITLVVINLIILSSALVIFVLFLIVILFMARNTILKVQKAVDNVEEAALIPLLSLKHMFSDAHGFVASAKAWLKMLTRKRRR